LIKVMRGVAVSTVRSGALPFAGACRDRHDGGDGIG
jgi:hypothetical protein